MPRTTEADVKAALEHLTRAIQSAGGDPRGIALHRGNASYHYENRLTHPKAGTLASRSLLGETAREAYVGLNALAEGVTLGAALAVMTPGTPDPYTRTAGDLLPCEHDDTEETR